MDAASPVAAQLRERLAARHGAAVVEPWWGRLGSMLERLAAAWALEIGEPVGRGNTSLVLRCRRADGSDAVLKLCPDPAVLVAEAEAVRGWARSGRVPVVWACDAQAGALLLEAIGDGKPLAKRAGRVTVGDVAKLIADLHAGGPVPEETRFESLAARVDFAVALWVQRRRRDPRLAAAVPAGRLERGAREARALAAEPAAAVVLHGDLHPANVLDGGPGRGLVAIDPRPCVGDPGVDAIDWVFWEARSPREWALHAERLAAALDYDPARLWRWCGAFAAMLAAGRAARGAPAADVAALLELAP